MGHIIKERDREITIDMILKEVSSQFSINIADIKSEKRVRSIMLPRQVAMYLARKMTDLSLGGYW